MHTINKPEYLLTGAPRWRVWLSFLFQIGPWNDIHVRIAHMNNILLRLCKWVASDLSLCQQRGDHDLIMSQLYLTVTQQACRFSLNIRQQAQGFYWQTAGEVQSPE